MSVAPLLLAALTAAGPAGTAGPADCRHLLSPDRIEAGRPVSEEDLARLRDIGGIFAAGAGEQVFTISPDGRRAALQIHRADPGRNAYCTAIVVVELRTGAGPMVVDAGDELILTKRTIDGRLDQPFGTARAITPRWSPDGRSLAFLKQVDGHVQAWVADAMGGGARRVTELPEGVDDVRWNHDGSSLLLSTRPDVPALKAALMREGLTGHRYDSRFLPMMNTAPYVGGPVATRFSSVGLKDGRFADATPREAALFADGVSADGRSVVSPRGDVAILRPDPSGLLERRQHLRVRRADGATFDCAAPECGSAIAGHWWSGDGARLEWLRREGDNAETSAVYSWRPGGGPPRLVLATSDLLFACQPAGRLVACARETPTGPRHLVTLDTRTGRIRTVFDPNPQFHTMRLGRVERLKLKDMFGAPLFADLVLPVGARPGTRHPLVVVQYESRGFLRGGTGDEYPIQVLAGRGFAVLSMNRPSLLAYANGVRNPNDLDRENYRMFRYRRGMHSGIEIAVAGLVARGLVDPARVGITGLSEGSSAVQWALIHDKRFAAAAMSGCCWGPQSESLVGLTRARDFRHAGFPSWADRGGDAFWREMSLVPHAAEIRTPTLVQASDDELLEGADAYTALEAASAPMDLVVFPGERHVKWQPAHRLAVYRRNVEWFSFWLQGRGDHPDLPRWRAFRERLGTGHPPPPDWSTPLMRPDQ